MKRLYKKQGKNKKETVHENVETQNFASLQKTGENKKETVRAPSLLYPINYSLLTISAGILSG